MKKMFIIFICNYLLFSFSCFSQTYDEFVAHSFDYLEKGDLFGAEESLKNALRKEPANPQNVLLLSNLGTIQRREKKFRDALVSYTSALSRSPRSTVLLSNRASLYTEMGDYENAITDYTLLLAIDEKNENVLYERGLLYLSKKDYIAAEIDFEKILEINPNTLNGRKGIATLCKLRGEYTDAEKIYNFLISKFPEDSNLYLSRAELFLMKDKNSRASSDINKALSLEERTGMKNPYTYILRSQLKIRQYEKKSAKQDIELAISLGYDKEKAEDLLKLCK